MRVTLPNGEAQDVLPEVEDYSGERVLRGRIFNVNIQEGMRYKGGVNPPSTMPRPQEPPKPFDPGWKAPTGEAS